jgi:hypothetical protein
MKYLFILPGVVLGIIEFLLLRKMTSKILCGDKGYIPVIAAKLLLYAAGISVVWLFFRQYIAYCGIGLGAAMLIGAIINFALTCKNDKKGDDAA